MINLFKKKIEELNLRGKRVGVAVSGGADSVALLDLCVELNLDVVILHCNFQLRGDESDGDEDFVGQLAELYNVSLELKRFDTQLAVEEEKGSTQMIARDLRYNWFNELVHHNKIDAVLVAHHLDDQIETFLINLARGTGVKGLTGMSAKNGNVYRLLLDFSRSEIEEYLHSKNLKFRTDSSNLKDDYKRNYSRHHILPHLLKLNPSFHKTFLRSQDRWKLAEEVLDEKIDDFSNSHLVNENHWVFELKDLNFELLKEFLVRKSFRAEEVAKFLDTIGEKVSGKYLVSADLVLRLDRNKLILSDETIDDRSFEILPDQLSLPIDENTYLRFEKIDKEVGFDFESDTSFAYLDFDQLKFPLTLRRWKEGDRFVPFGMKGKVKLSDYFINYKFSAIRKKSTWIMLSGDDIVWIVGERSDNRYRIGEQTKKIYLAQVISTE